MEKFAEVLFLIDSDEIKKKLFGALEWSRFSIFMSNAVNDTNIAKQ